MRVLGILTYRVEGAERLREPGRLIVANHPTLLDVVLLVSQMPEVDCIVKRGLWRNPFLRWPVSWAGYLPNCRGRRAHRRVLGDVAARPLAAGVSRRHAHRAGQAAAHAARRGPHRARRRFRNPAGDDHLRSADAVQRESVVSRARAAFPHARGRRRRRSPRAISSATASRRRAPRAASPSGCSRSSMPGGPAAGSRRSLRSPGRSVQRSPVR